jgi:hypothetical protein
MVKIRNLANIVSKKINNENFVSKLDFFLKRGIDLTKFSNVQQVLIIDDEGMESTKTCIAAGIHKSQLLVVNEKWKITAKIEKKYNFEVKTYTGKIEDYDMSDNHFCMVYLDMENNFTGNKVSDASDGVFENIIKGAKHTAVRICVTTTNRGHMKSIELQYVNYPKGNYYRLCYFRVDELCRKYKYALVKFDHNNYPPMHGKRPMLYFETILDKNGHNNMPYRGNIRRKARREIITIDKEDQRQMGGKRNAKYIAINKIFICLAMEKIEYNDENLPYIDLISDDESDMDVDWKHI